MKRLFQLILLISLSTSLSGQSRPATLLAIIHVTVIDCTGSMPLPDMTVVIDNDKITAIGASSSVKIPAGSRIIDAKGKFLIPGLWDMHTHIRNDYPGANKDAMFPIFCSLYIANGVTGIRNMGGPGGYHLHWNIQKRDAIAAGTILGPRIVTASQPLDGPNVTDGDKLPISNEAQARQAVQEIKKSGADFVKVYDGLPRNAYFALADECKKQNVTFAGHVPSSITAEEASNAGQKSIEHLSRVAEACYVYEQDETKPVTDNDPETTERLKTILIQLWEGNIDHSLLLPEMSELLSTDAAKHYLKASSDEQGKLKSIEFRGVRADQRRKLYLYKSVYEKLSRYENFFIASDGRIGWLPAEANIYSENKAAALFGALKKNQTWQCPTLVALRAIAYRDDPGLFADPRLKYLPQSIRMLLHPKNDIRLSGFTGEVWARQKREYERASALIAKMRSAGIEFLAGTDAITDFCIPGFSLHDELELLVKAGLSSMEALQAATRNPAKYFGLIDTLGTVEKGKVADLVLLDANPVEEIGNTRTIRAVVVNGKFLPKESLQELLAAAETQAAKM